MLFDLDKRTATLGVGDFADFKLGPRESEGGAQGLWRAQLGTHWHQQLRRQAELGGAQVRFELTVCGEVFHKGWLLQLRGRIDQLVLSSGTAEIREIKSVLRTLPADESELRSEYEAYFVQAAAYERLLSTDQGSLRESGNPGVDARWLCTLVFVEADTGLTQQVRLGLSDKALLEAQLDRVVGFLEQRRLARERLRKLRLRPAFAELRAGQADAITTLEKSLSGCHSAILFEAPTGFGKTGVLLEAALRHLKQGHFDRLLYLTSKATGQLQVASTLRSMTAPETSDDGLHSVSSWTVRPKTEHCVAPVYHCSREVCGHLRDLRLRWEKAGLARHFLDPEAPRDIASLRRSGQEAGVCPYEITRAALPFCDLWIGDFNYVFSPSSSGLFLLQPGFEAGRSLLIIDEAHNLPQRAADAYSHRFQVSEAQDLLDALHRIHAPASLLRACDHWTHFLRHLPQKDSLTLAEEDDARDLLRHIADLTSTTALDYATLGPEVSGLLWSIPEFMRLLSEQPLLARHWWATKSGVLQSTCLDAAPVIGPLLGSFGGVILASATFGPVEDFAGAIGLAEAKPAPQALPLARVSAEAEAPARLAPQGRFGILNKKDSKKLLSKVTTGAELMRVEETLEATSFTRVGADAPWRDQAYRVAVDLRVDTRYEQRERYLGLTALTVQRLAFGKGRPGARLAAFFPSYAYAEAVLARIAADRLGLQCSLQPRSLELAEQTAWIEQALANSEALFLVLGSSFAESIDVLGGRLDTAMVIGPALPEVNPIQQARLMNLSPKGRDQAFRTVYQIPGMQKVNQALGRLVRAPGHQARVLLHCRRFAEPSYARLLCPEYKQAEGLADDAAFDAWLTGPTGA